MAKARRAIQILREDGFLLFVLKSLEYVTHPLHDPLFKPAINRLYSGGTDMAKEEWDHLLILDACRADMFEEVVGPVGEQYERVRSNASATPEWIERTFSEKRLGDTVYVTSNPWASREAPDSFHDIVNLWVEETELEHADIQQIEGNLDDVDLDLPDTIPARKVTDRALEVASEYPRKRVIVHYFQPHAPCIGKPNGTELDEPLGLHALAEEFLRGDVTREEVWDAHCDNLAYAWHHAKRYIDEVDGRIVVSADHGELFGEFLFPFPMSGYSHPRNLHHPYLTTVPWAVFEKEHREISDDGCNSVLINEEANRARLKHLGYMVDSS